MVKNLSRGAASRTVIIAVVVILITVGVIYGYERSASNANPEDAIISSLQQSQRDRSSLRGRVSAQLAQAKDNLAVETARLNTLRGMADAQSILDKAVTESYARASGNYSGIPGETAREVSGDSVNGNQSISPNNNIQSTTTLAIQAQIQNQKNVIDQTQKQIDKLEKLLVIINNPDPNNLNFLPGGNPSQEPAGNNQDQVSGNGAGGHADEPKLIEGTNRI